MFGALLSELSKAFDCVPHDIINAKLNACIWVLYEGTKQYLRLFNKL